MSEDTFAEFKAGRACPDQTAHLLFRTYGRAIGRVAHEVKSAYGVPMTEAVVDVCHAAWELFESWKPDRGPLRSWLSGGRLKLRAIDQVRKMTGVVKGNDRSKGWGSLELLAVSDIPTYEFETNDELDTIDERDLVGVVPRGDSVKQDLFEGFKEGNQCRTAIALTAERFPHISRKEIRKSAYELRRDLAHILQSKYPQLLEGRTHEAKMWGESRRKFRLKRPRS